MLFIQHISKLFKHYYQSVHLICHVGSEMSLWEHLMGAHSLDCNAHWSLQDIDEEVYLNKNPTTCLIPLCNWTHLFMNNPYKVQENNAHFLQAKPGLRIVYFTERSAGMWIKTREKKRTCVAITPYILGGGGGGRIGEHTKKIAKWITHQAKKNVKFCALTHSSSNRFRFNLPIYKQWPQNL